MLISFNSPTFFRLEMLFIGNVREKKKREPKCCSVFRVTRRRWQSLRSRGCTTTGLVSQKVFASSSSISFRLFDSCSIMDCSTEQSSNYPLWDNSCPARKTSSTILLNAMLLVKEEEAGRIKSCKTHSDVLWQSIATQQQQQRERLESGRDYYDQLMMIDDRPFKQAITDERSFFSSPHNPI